jgi:cytochrome c
MNRIIKHIVFVAVVIFALTGCGSQNLDKARDFIKLGMYEDAVKLLRLEIQEEPKNEEAHYLMGVAHLHMGQELSASESFERAIQLDDDLHSEVSEAYYLVGVEKLDEGKQPQAVYFFVKAKQRDPAIAKKIAELFFNKGSGLAKSSLDRTIMLAYLKQALKFYPEYSNKIGGICLDKEVSTFEMKNWEAAVAYGECSIGAVPDNAEAHFLLGFALFNQGLKSRVEDSFNRAVLLDSDYREKIGARFFSMGKESFEKSNAYKAIALFKKAVAWNPVLGSKIAGILFEKGTEVAETANNVDDVFLYIFAASEFDKTYQQKAGNLCLKLVKLSLQKGEWNTAAGYGKCGVNSMSGNAESHYLLGLAYLHKGSERRAISSFDRAILLDSQYRDKTADAYHQVGSKHLKRSDLQKALHFFRIANEKDPSTGSRSAEILFNKGLEVAETSPEAEDAILYLKLGEGFDAAYRVKNGKFCSQKMQQFIDKAAWETAAVYGRCSTSREPDNNQAHYLLGLAYLNMGSLAKAKTAFERSIQLDSVKRKKIANVYYQFGSEIAEKGELQKSLPYFKGAVQNDATIGSKAAALLFDVAAEFENSHSILNTSDSSYTRKLLSVDSTIASLKSSFAFDNSYKKIVGKFCFKKAMYYYDIEAWEIAGKYTECSIRHTQEIADLLYSKGIEYAKNGDEKGFQASFQAAILARPDFLPEDAESMFYLARYHSSFGEKHKAKRLYADIAATFPATSFGKKAKSIYVKLKSHRVENIIGYGKDYADGTIGNWDSQYPQPSFNDQQGRSGTANAKWDGSYTIEGKELCLIIDNLEAPAPPSNALGVGYTVTLSNAVFADGKVTKDLELYWFLGAPKIRHIKKCYKIKQEQQEKHVEDAILLATSSGCMACHKIDMQLVGPAYNDVAAKYRYDPDALEMLTAKVKAGGVGVWGQIPMPPNAHVSDDDIKMIVRWVLSQGDNLRVDDMQKEFEKKKTLERAMEQVAKKRKAANKKRKIAASRQADAGQSRRHSSGGEGKEFDKYVSQIRSKIAGNWRKPSGMTNGLTTSLRVKLMAGAVLSQM